MAERNNTYKYVFTVEGDTEKWYLDWLSEKIKDCDEISDTVSIKSTIQQSPMKFAKGINNLTTPEIFHVCDVESKETKHVEKLKRILKEMKEAKENKGISYKLGYSNFTFELWMVLHKQDCNGHLTNRTQYLPHINKAFNEKFDDLDKYKVHDAFKRCLSKLTLKDVKKAIERAERITKTNEEDGVKINYHHGYKYYDENPSLSIWKAVKKILVDCGYIKEEKTKSSKLEAEE